MSGDRRYDDGYNLFSCLSRFACTFLTFMSLQTHKNLMFVLFLLRNPWLPGWILTSTLILSVLVLIWICCATVATAVDQYVPAEVKSVTIFAIDLVLFTLFRPDLCCFYLKPLKPRGFWIFFNAYKNFCF